MIIDGHAHASGNFLKKDSLEKTLNDNMVDKVILVPGELNSEKIYKMKDYTIKKPEKDHIRMFNLLTKMLIFLFRAVKTIKPGNEFVFKLKQEVPDRIIQFFWITKYETGNRKPAQVLDERYKEMGFSGIKMHQNWESFSVGDGYFTNLMNWAEEKDFPVFIHFFSLKEVKKFVEFKKNRPNLKFIHGHLYGFEHIWEKVKEDKNYIFDLSSANLISEMRIEKGVKLLGPKRFTMGSDTPFGENALEHIVKRIKNTNLTEEEKKMIMGENIREFLNIKEST